MVEKEQRSRHQRKARTPADVCHRIVFGNKRHNKHGAHKHKDDACRKQECIKHVQINANCRYKLVEEEFMGAICIK